MPSGRRRWGWIGLLVKLIDGRGTGCLDERAIAYVAGQSRAGGLDVGGAVSCCTVLGEEVDIVQDGRGDV